jgi:nucleolar protein 56
MKAHLAKTAIGYFAFDDNQNLLFHKLFKPDAHDVAERLGKPIENDFLEKLVGFEATEDESGRKTARKNIRKYSVSLGFVKSESEFNEFMARLGMELSNQRLMGIITRDLIIVQSSNSLDSLNKFINILTEHFKEWFWLNYPEFGGDNEEIINNLVEYGTRDKFPDFKSSYGLNFDEEDIKAVKDLAIQLDSLMKEKKSLENYLRKITRETAPNFSYLVDEILAAKMISLAGSLDNLAKMPASTLQLLGAEKALFRHLKNRRSRPPKFGVLYDSSYVRNAPFEKKGKIARIVASQLSKAAKIDFYSKRDDKENLKKEMEKEIETVMKSENKN